MKIKQIFSNSTEDPPIEKWNLTLEGWAFFLTEVRWRWLEAYVRFGWSSSLIASVSHTSWIRDGGGLIGRLQGCIVVRRESTAGHDEKRTIRSRPALSVSIVCLCLSLSSFLLPPPPKFSHFILSGLLLYVYLETVSVSLGQRANLKRWYGAQCPTHN